VLHVRHETHFSFIFNAQIAKEYSCNDVII